MPEDPLYIPGYSSDYSTCRSIYGGVVRTVEGKPAHQRQQPPFAKQAAGLGQPLANYREDQLAQEATQNAGTSRAAQRSSARLRGESVVRWERLPA